MKNLSWLVAAALPLASCGGAASAAGVTLTRDAALGAKYKTLGPRTCAAPPNTADALSAADARAYVICFMEREFGTDQLALVTNVAVQVAPARPYNHLTDYYDHVDPRRPVHDIRGTLDNFACSVPDDYNLRVGGGFPCRGQPYKHGEGTCYHDTFGDWHCVFHDFTANINDVKPMNPPTGD